MHRFLVVFLIGFSITFSITFSNTATAFTASAPRAGAGGGGDARADDRAATQILDSIPLPDDSEPTRIGDRARRYSVSVDAATVLSFFRDQLRAAGWQEKSVSEVPLNTNGVATNDGLGREDEGEAEGGATNGGTENAGEGTVGTEGSGTGNQDTTSRQLEGPVRGRWTMGGATLSLKIVAAAIANSQTQSESLEESTFVLRARPAQ